MKKSSLISAVVFVLMLCLSFQMVNAQEKSKEEKEKELQDLIIEQKKAMVDQKKAQAEMQKVLEDQDGFKYLELPPRTLTGRDHRPAYTSDGDYYSNPISDDLFELVYSMMHEVNPKKFPSLF